MQLSRLAALVALIGLSGGCGKAPETASSNGDAPPRAVAADDPCAHIAAVEKRRRTRPLGISRGVDMPNLLREELEQCRREAGLITDEDEAPVAGEQPAAETDPTP